MTTSSPDNVPVPPGGRGVWIPVGVAAVLAALLFGPLWMSGQYHFTTDNNIGQTAYMRAALQAGNWFGMWHDTELLGLGAPMAPGWLWGWMWLLPVGAFHNLIHTLDLTLASLFLALFLRRRGVTGAAAAVGVVTAFWMGTFTISYAGHIGKFGVMMFAPAFLWLADRAARPGNGASLVLAGGALGLMFCEQADLALLVALLTAPYLPYAILREQPRRWGRALARSGVAAGIALLVAVPALWSGYRGAVSGVAVMEDPAAKWEYVTQWSLPPDEVVDFVTPGFFGWRSGEPEGPYWGRIGRSEGWEKTRQGLMNFRLDSSYLGLVPVALALFAVMLALFRTRRDPEGKGVRNAPPDTTAVLRPDVLFWALVAVVALALAMGKYSLLYKLFYQLPFVSSIRAPVKTLHVFQLAAGVLAAFGAHAVWEGGRARAAAWFRRLLGGAAVGLGLAALVVALGFDDRVTAFAREGWGALAPVIVKGQMRALAHAAVLAGLAAAAFAWMRRTPHTGARTAALAAVLVLCAGDAFLLGRRFVVGMPRSVVAESELVRTLKRTQPMHRCAFLTQEGVYNNWLTYLLPYHGLQAMNMTQMPRMSTDYQALLQRVGRDPLRLWEVGAVDQVVAPAEAWNQIQQTPGWRDRFTAAGAFNVVADVSGQYAIPASVPPGQTGTHVILKLRTPVPRYALCAVWKTLGDEDALARLADPRISLPGIVAVAPEAGLAPPPAGAPDAPAGPVRVVSARPGRVELEVEASVPALLRIADKFDPDWRAWVDGRPVPVLRADYLLQAVPVPAGAHRVRLAYRPSRAPLVPAAAGGAVWLAALAWALAARRRAVTGERPS